MQLAYYSNYSLHNSQHNGATSLSALFISLHLLMSTFSFACSSFHSFSQVVNFQSALHPVYPHFIWRQVSALQLLQSGILSLQISECVKPLKPSAITPRPIISSRTSNPLSTYRNSCASDSALADLLIFFTYLARSANLPIGLCILPSVISSFFTMSKAISVSTGPIFTIFTPNGRYLREFS